MSCSDLKNFKFIKKHENEYTVTGQCGVFIISTPLKYYDEKYFTMRCYKNGRIFLVFDLIKKLIKQCELERTSYDMAKLNQNSRNNDTEEGPSEDFNVGKSDPIKTIMEFNDESDCESDDEEDNIGGCDVNLYMIKTKTAINFIIIGMKPYLSNQNMLDVYNRWLRNIELTHVVSKAKKTRDGATQESRIMIKSSKIKLSPKKLILSKSL